ncbi:MAG: 2,3-bisphosphoglycerate-dependent phosphoglycerate mutase [Candidatus Azotimanducaceae bacterium]|jgi:2,3-bisphosphoglycerate-dependent phosphoglycerate mutase
MIERIYQYFWFAFNMVAVSIFCDFLLKPRKMTSPRAVCSMPCVTIPIQQTPGVKRIMVPFSVLALIRHGDYQQPTGVPSALLPYPLTPEGMEQAAACARLLQNYASDNNLNFHPQVDCSRQLRAYQTAGTIIAGLSMPELRICEHEALAERSVGAMANLDLQQIEAIVEADPRYEPLPHGWKSSSDYCLPYQGAESLRHAGARVAQHIQSVWQTIAPQQLKIIVGHGASIRHAAACLGMINEAEISALSMYHASPIFIRQDRAGAWQRLEGEWKIRQKAGDEFGE